MENQNPQEENSQNLAPSEGEAPNEGNESETQPKGRTAEDRINELLSKNKEMEEELRGTKEEVADLRQKMTVVPAPTTEVVEEKDPKVKEAIKFIKKEGRFVDENYVEDRLKTIKDQMIIEREHQRLSDLYNGEDGRPKYDPAKIEEFARKRGVWDFEIAYEKLYKDEIFDWTIKKMESDRKKKPYVVRPNSTSGQDISENTITRAKISEWLKTPEGRTKYEQNRGKILKLMAEGKLES